MAAAENDPRSKRASYFWALVFYQCHVTDTCDDVQWSTYGLFSQLEVEEVFVTWWFVAPIDSDQKTIVLKFINDYFNTLK